VEPARLVLIDANIQRVAVVGPSRYEGMDRPLQVPLGEIGLDLS